MDEPKNIIVRMPNWIGDVIMATPLLRDLKTRFPNSQLSVLCQPPVASMMDDADDVITFTKSKDMRELINTLRAGRYDLGILTTNSFSSAWWFYKGNVKNRIGFGGNMRSWLLTRALSFPENRKTQHLVNTYKELLVPLGIPISETPPRLSVAEEEAARAKMLLKEFQVHEDDILIGVNPCAAYGSAKCWLPERFSALAKKLIESDERIKVLFFGSGDSVPLVNEICHDLPPGAVNFAGVTSLKELVSITSLCQLFITNDSGPMHIADALGVPLVAIFGSTDPVATGPYNTGEVLQRKVACSPCFKRTCPIDFRCMKKITVDDVYNEARRKLACLSPSLIP